MTMTQRARHVADVSVDTDAAPEVSVQRWVARRISVIWGLLFFNGMAPLPIATVVPIPHAVEQMMTVSALGLALVLALGVNRRMRIRSNVVLSLYLLLLPVVFATGLHGTAGIGSLLRVGRMAGFVATLWLLTPWWGRRDHLLLRCHLRALLVVLASVVIGLVLAPSKALSGSSGGGRLTGVLWPIPAPQVAEYAAVAAGCCLVLWLSGAMKRTPAMLVAGAGIAVIVLSHTRTAALGLAFGVAGASLTLVLARRRVRRTIATIALVAPLALVVLAPAFSAWFARDQSSAAISGLTGRKAVWATVLDQPRSEFERLFGFGLSNNSSNGRPIDDTWLAVYKDEGLVGDGLIGAILLFLLVLPGFRPPGPERAVAVFLVLYCAFASYTEVTLGQANPYLLHVVVAASLLFSAQRGKRLTQAGIA